MDKHFLMTPEGAKHLVCSLSEFKACFISVRDKSVLVIEAEHTGLCTIRCDRMELAANLVQEIAEHFNFTELKSEADFPYEFSGLS